MKYIPSQQNYLQLYYNAGLKTKICIFLWTIITWASLSAIGNIHTKLLDERRWDDEDISLFIHKKLWMPW